MSSASLLVCLYFLTRIMYTSPVLWRQENFSWARNRKESQRNTMQLALWISQNLLNNSSPAAIYCKNPTSCKSSLVPVSHLTSASKKLFLSLSFKVPSRIRFPCHVALELSSCFELDVLLEAWTLSMFFQDNWWENIILLYIVLILAYGS